MTLINFGSKDPVPQQALPPAKKFLPVDDKVLEMTLKVRRILASTVLCLVAVCTDRCWKRDQSLRK